MIIIKKFISIFLALVILCVAGSAAQANAEVPEAAQSDADAIISITDYTGTALLSIVSDAFRLVEISLFRFDSLFSLLMGVERNTVAVTYFDWSDDLPVLDKDASCAYNCTLALDDDVNFLQIFSDVTVWYEYSENGLFWYTVRRDNGCTFVRNKLWQGYLYNAADSSVVYNSLWNTTLPSGTRFTVGVSGDASDLAASVYNLATGTDYYIRLVMYVRTDTEHLLYKSPALKCVR